MNIKNAKMAIFQSLSFFHCKVETIPSETFRRIKGHAALEAPSTKIIIWDFLEGPVVKTVIPMQGAKARSLVKELRSHVLHEVAK